MGDRPGIAASLCLRCSWKRDVVTARSRFLRCERARADSRFPKYPMQPVVRCGGFEPRGEAPPGRTAPEDAGAPGA